MAKFRPAISEPPESSTGARPARPRNVRLRLVCAGLLAMLAATLYCRTTRFEFVNFDDDVHVYENRYVRTGLTVENLRWSFGVHGPSQWHPLAWISHQIDSQLHGASPDGPAAGGHHLTNVLCHMVAVVLAFFVFEHLTANTGIGILVAALFAIHPLNVESVAWVSERRNVLSAVFFLWTLLAYLQYARHGGRWRYAHVLGAFAAGLMAKPMLVTLPCVLLLLDFWPLRRAAFSPRGGAWDGAADLRRGPTALVVEKLPLFALSAVSSYLTIRCQQAAGVVSTIDALPFDVRVANALVAYGNYLRKTVWPTDLGAFYPHPGFIDEDPLSVLLFPAAISAIVLVTITVLCLGQRRSRPYLLVGWLWFLGMLVPVIGIFQVGEQQWADRYAYLPNLGLYLAAACTLAEFATSAARRRVCAAVVGLVIIALSIRCWSQIGTWRDSVTLFSHLLQVDERNHWGHLNLGLALAERGETVNAIGHYRAALEIDRDYQLAHYNLGVCLHDRGDRRRAAYQFDESIRLAPRHADSWVRLGIIAGEVGRLALARRHFETALRCEPENVSAMVNLGLLHEHAGESATARRWYAAALQIDPDFEDARRRFGRQ